MFEVVFPDPIGPSINRPNAVLFINLPMVGGASYFMNVLNSDHYC
jgi:hypothetical protein